MNWIVKFLRSSIGRKLIMGLTGLFLISFLIIHLIGNLQVIKGKESFDAFVHFMEHNPIISVMAWGLYLGFLLHIIQGFVIYFANRKTAGGKYAVAPKNQKDVTFVSRNMALLGTFLLAFLIMHLGDFFAPLKITETLPEADLFAEMVLKFKDPIHIIFYTVGMLVLSLHLWHGFQSAFQTLGLNHPKYTPIIKGLGKLYSIIIPLLFAIIPFYVYLYL